MMKALAEAQVVRGRSLVAALAAIFLTVAAHAAAPHPFLDGKLSWRNIGPNIGGRVVAVTGVPGERNLFYMGGVDGGVWKSTDYGVAWHNIPDGKLPSASDSIGAGWRTLSSSETGSAPTRCVGESGVTSSGYSASIRRSSSISAS